MYDLLDLVRWALVAILGGFVALLRWNANRVIARVDALEKEKASTTAVADLRAEMKEHRQETRDALREINSNILTIVSKLK